MESVSDGSKSDSIGISSFTNPAANRGSPLGKAHGYNNNGSSAQKKLYDFLRCLITCHTVVRERTGAYRAESPDELALVEGIAGYRSKFYIIDIEIY